MSKLNVDQKTIMQLFQDEHSDFLIPDYQRPYAWGENECQTLWDDVFAFAIPDNGRTNFDRSSEYFLGPIVTFKNQNMKMEVIDGQQRLTTILLLLRAFYTKFDYMQDPNSVATRENIEKCIWKTDEYGKPDLSALKIDSEVATDKDKDEFLAILKSGSIENGQKSRYATNYKFFLTCIDNFLNQYPSYFALLPNRIMRNCILLPIEAESQDTALKIFSTLNDRGMPLSDSDIFKAQFYKYYTQKGEKDAFIKKWKELEELTERIFHPQNGTAMDELFTRYMYYIRAKMGIKLSTTEALRKFYEKNNYSLLKSDETLDDLNVLAHFWEDVSNQEKDRFSQKALCRLFVLNYAPNGMWTYFTSVYFMQNRNAQNMLDDEKFCTFLSKMIGFIWTYAVTNPGVNALRTPIYSEMVNVVNNQPVTFEAYRFDGEKVRSTLRNFSFTNIRPITKAMLAWWAFQNPAQQLLSLETVLEIEHIYARNRYDKEHTLKNQAMLDALGNKAFLEKRINIRAADYRFSDKIRYYRGYVNGKNEQRKGTMNRELLQIAETTKDFGEKEILQRTERIIDAFVAYLAENGLLQQ